MTTDAATTAGAAELASLPGRYFAAVDSKSVDDVLMFFAGNATFTIQTDGVTFRGVEQLAEMFNEYFAALDRIVHEVRNIVVDADNFKIATEQWYEGTMKDGTTHTAYNANFFTLDDGGKIARIMLWVSGTNPLEFDRE